MLQNVAPMPLQVRVAQQGVSAAVLRTWEGTIWPFLIISATMLPSGLPLFMCARSRSPALRCTMPNSSTSFAHCGVSQNPGSESLPLNPHQPGMACILSSDQCPGQQTGKRAYINSERTDLMPQCHGATQLRHHCRAHPQAWTSLTCVPFPDPGPPSTKTMVRCFVGVLDPLSVMPASARFCPGTT